MLKEQFKSVIARMIACGCHTDPKRAISLARMAPHDSVLPLEEFFAWVERTPEVREIMLECGIAWDGAVTNQSLPMTVRSLPVTTPISQAATTLRVKYGEQYESVSVIERMASFLKVQRGEVGAGGRVDLVQMVLVHPDDLEKANALPGADADIEWGSQINALATQRIQASDLFGGQTVERPGQPEGSGGNQGDPGERVAHQPSEGTG